MGWGFKGEGGERWTATMTINPMSVLAWDYCRSLLIATQVTSCCLEHGQESDYSNMISGVQPHSSTLSEDVVRSS